MRADVNNRSPRAVLIDGDQAIREHLKTQLLRSGIKVIGESDDAQSGLRLIRGLEPDVVFMELPANATDTLGLVQRLQEEMPRTTVIVSAHDPTPQMILSSMRAGAREFLTRPIDTNEFEKAIDHLRKQSMRVSNSSRTRGSVISVFATKGGSGATTMACNLAVALSENGNAKVALVDLSLQMGEVLMHMNLPQRYSLADAVREGSIDQASLRNVMSRHDCGAYVIVGANRAEEAEDLHKERLVEVFGILNTMFDYVVVDMGRHIDDRSMEVFDLSDNILLVTQLNLPAIRNTAHYLDLFKRLEADTTKMQIVMNRYHKKYEFDLDDLESTVGRQAFWVVPNDYASVTAASNAGVPLIMNNPRSKVSRNIRKLAETLHETHTRHVAGEEVGAIAG